MALRKTDREYWIVNPITRTVNTFVFDNPEDEGPAMSTFDQEIGFALYPGLKIRLADFI